MQTNPAAEHVPGLGPLAVLRFTAELGMLAALGYGGWHLSMQTAASVALALALPLAAALVWGRWVAPRAPRRLSDPARLAVEVMLFGAAFALLVLAGPDPLTAILGVGLVVLFLVSLPHRKTELRLEA